MQPLSEVVESRGTGVTDISEPACGFWVNIALLQEQMVLKDEPSLKAENYTVLESSFIYI